MGGAVLVAFFGYRQVLARGEPIVGDRFLDGLTGRVFLSQAGAFQTLRSGAVSETAK
jgi:hypothetical protein